MDEKYIATPTDRLFAELARSLTARLTAMGFEVELTRDQNHVKYTGTVRHANGIVGKGSDWSPVAALEKAYADQFQKQRIS